MIYLNASKNFPPTCQQSEIPSSRKLLGAKKRESKNIVNKKGGDKYSVPHYNNRRLLKTMTAFLLLTR